MKNIEELMKDALVWYGAMLENWRLKIVRVYATGADSANVELQIFEPRRRKPTVSWIIPVDTARNNVYVSEGTFTYL